MSGSLGMRLAVYCDYSYRLDDGKLYAELPVGIFLRELSRYCQRFVVTGRLDPSPGRYPYAMDGVNFAPLPHYRSGARLGGVVRTIPAAVRRFWRMLDEVDVVWILGPVPLAPVFVALTALRRRRLVLGVRQDLLELTRFRHAGKPLVQFTARALEAWSRLLARFVPTVVVGPDLGRRYRLAKALHVTYVSLLHEREIMAPEADHRVYDGAELRMLSVGRLDPEKNPLLLADVLEHAVRSDPRWRLDVCGDGPLATALAERLDDLGVADRASLHGHVPIDDGLWSYYRRSHALLHVSLTEGVPQVLLEAFAARLPVVATAVGGVPEVLRGRGLLVAPGDAGAAAAALDRLASNPELRAELVASAATSVRDHTLELECASLAAFLAAPGDDSGQRGREHGLLRRRK